MPSVSLSVLDSDIWLAECVCVGIPSIQICDTQSHFDKITYPIIANQRSLAFTHLILHLAVEVCNTSLLSSHLNFISYYKYHNNNQFTSVLNRTQTIPNQVSKISVRQHCYYIFRLGPFQAYGFDRDRTPGQFLDAYNAKREILNLRKRKLFWVRKQYLKKEKKAVLIQERSYIYNKRFFTYQLKNLSNNKVNFPMKIINFFSLFKQKLYLYFLTMKTTFDRTIVLLKKGPYPWRRHYYKLYGNEVKTMRRLICRLIIKFLGFRIALARKRRGNHRFMTLINIKKRDIKNLFICAAIPFIFSKKNKLKQLYYIPSKSNKPDKIFVLRKQKITNTKIFPDNPSGIQIRSHYKKWKKEPIMQLTSEKKKHFYKKRARERYNKSPRALTNQKWARKSKRPFTFTDI